METKGLGDAVKWTRHSLSTCHSDVSAIILANGKASPWLRSAYGHSQVMESEILWTRGQMEPLAECWGWAAFPEEAVSTTDAPACPFPHI